MKTKICGLLLATVLSTTTTVFASTESVLEKNIGEFTGEYVGSNIPCEMSIQRDVAGSYIVTINKTTAFIDEAFTQKRWRHKLKNVTRGRHCGPIARYWGCEDIPNTITNIHYDHDQKVTGFETIYGYSYATCVLK